MGLGDGLDMHPQLESGFGHSGGCAPPGEILHPPEKYKDGLFNSTLKQLSPKGALFSLLNHKIFACGGLLQGYHCLGSPYAPPEISP